MTQIKGSRFAIFDEDEETVVAKPTTAPKKVVTAPKPVVNRPKTEGQDQRRNQVQDTQGGDFETVIATDKFKS